MGAIPGQTEPRWRRLPEERPKQILAAALEVFGERGLASARLEDIAKRAGLSKGTIYLYFPNKEELFREMVRQRRQAPPGARSVGAGLRPGRQAHREADHLPALDHRQVAQVVGEDVGAVVLGQGKGGLELPGEIRLAVDRLDRVVAGRRDQDRAGLGQERVVDLLTIKIANAQTSLTMSRTWTAVAGAPRCFTLAHIERRSSGLISVSSRLQETGRMSRS